MIHRNLFYIFFWVKTEIPLHFRIHAIETIKVIVVTNPRKDLFGFFLYLHTRNVITVNSSINICRITAYSYQILYTQATSKKIERHLHIINWWTRSGGIFRYPLLPAPSKVYSSFGGRLFRCPALHVSTVAGQ